MCAARVLSRDTGAGGSFGVGASCLSDTPLAGQAGHGGGLPHA